MQVLFNLEYLLHYSIYMVNSVKDSYEQFKWLFEESLLAFKIVIWYAAAWINFVRFKFFIFI